MRRHSLAERARRFWAGLVMGAMLVLLVASAADANFTREIKFSTLQHDDWEPSIGADQFGNVYWATTRYGGRRACDTCPDPAIVFRVSSDNGVTWSKPRFLCRCPGVGGQHDPVLSVDDRGRVFATWMNDFEVSFARSDDFGTTWTRAGPLDGKLRYSDKPWIRVSGSGDDVYVTFNGNGPAPGAPYAVYSHNAGESWSPPIRTRHNRLYWFAGGLTVTPDGTVDGGVTWGPRQLLSNRRGGAPYKSERGFRFPYGDYGQLAIDSDGNTQATWGEGPSYVGPGGSWYARGNEPKAGSHRGQFVRWG